MKCRPLPSLRLAVMLMLSLLACASSQESSSATQDGDASIDGGYSGGGSVIPSTSETDGASEGGVTSYGYGTRDAEALSPCPRDAAAKGHAEAAATLGDAAVDDADDADECPSALGPGDLIIDELMIASKPGAGDHGEWIEVASTRACALDLKGLFAEVPHGKGVTTATVADDVLLPPHGFFIIADSAEPSTNNNLPGTVFVWGSGTSSDVLLNSGDTITLYTAAAVIDSLTYPDSSKLVDGSSMEFPTDCPASSRAEFGNWQPAISSWTPGFFGTPMAPNADVSCAILPPAPSSSPCDG